MVAWPTQKEFETTVLSRNALRYPDDVRFQVGNSEGVEEFYADARKTIGLILVDNGADSTVLLEATIKEGHGRSIADGGAIVCTPKDLEHFGLVKIYRQRLAESVRSKKELGLDSQREILENYRAIHRRATSILTHPPFSYHLRIGQTDYAVEFELPDFGEIEERNGWFAVRPELVIGDPFTHPGAFGRSYGFDPTVTAIHDQSSNAVVGLKCDGIRGPLQEILDDLNRQLNHMLGITGLDVATVNIKARIIPGQKITFVITDLANALNRISKIA